MRDFLSGQIDYSWLELKSVLLVSVWTQSDFIKNENKNTQ